MLAIQLCMEKQLRLSELCVISQVSAACLGVTLSEVSLYVVHVDVQSSCLFVKLEYLQAQACPTML